MQFDILEVTCKETGDKMKIKGHKFNPELHSDPVKFGVGGTPTPRSPFALEEPATVVVVEEEKEVAAEIVVHAPVRLEETEDGVEEVSERPFACLQCDKAFKRQQDVATHTKIYHKEV